MLGKAEARVQHHGRPELVSLVQGAAAGIAVDRIAVSIRPDALRVALKWIALRQPGAESDHNQLVVLAKLKVETADEEG